MFLIGLAIGLAAGYVACWKQDAILDFIKSKVGK